MMRGVNGGSRIADRDRRAQVFASMIVGRAVLLAIRAPQSAIHARLRGAR